MQSDSTPTAIYQNLRIFGVAGLGIILLMSCFLYLHSSSHLNPFIYFSISTAIWLFSYWHAWKRADLNRRDINSVHYPNLGWANGLTLLRGGLIALTGGFLLQPAPYGLLAWIPGVIYGLAAILDRIDGFVARRTKRTTLLGSELDTVFDALGLLIAPLLAIQLGKLDWSFLTVSLAYYFFIAGIYWRQKKSRPVYPLLPSQLRRAFAGFQMGFVALALIPLFPAKATKLLGTAFMLPILIGFAFDWLIVSGRVIGTSAPIQKLLRRIDLLSKNLLQPALRFTVGLLVVSLLQFNTQLFEADAFGVNQSNHASLVLSLLAILIITGTGARLAAFALLITCTYLFNYTAIYWYQSILLIASSWLLLLGPGNYCLWRGDDIWVNRQDGA